MNLSCVPNLHHANGLPDGLRAIMVCSKQAAAELRGSSSNIMVESLETAKRVREEGSAPSKKSSVSEAILAAEADALLHRKVSRAPLVQHVILSRLCLRRLSAVDPRRSHFTLLCGGPIQAMHAARLEANAANESMHQMMSSLKVRSTLFQHVTTGVFSESVSFSITSDCVSLDACPQSLKRTIVRSDVSLSGGERQSAKSSVKTGFGESGNTKAASARGPLRPQPPRKQKERGYQTARGHPVSLV